MEVAFLKINKIQQNNLRQTAHDIKVLVNLYA